MWRAQDGAVPVAHEQIRTVFKAIAAGLGTETLFALFELLQKAKVARDLCHGYFLAGGVFPFCLTVKPFLSGLASKRGDAGCRSGEKEELSILYSLCLSLICFFICLV